MIGWRKLLLGCLLLVAFVPRALAFVDPPVLVPQHPVAGETVSVSIKTGVCDGFPVKQGYPKVTRNGKSIRILLASVHASGSFCIFPKGEYQAVVGSFSQGSYDLQVDRVYDNFAGNPEVEPLGVLHFTVASAPLTAVPMLGAGGLAALLFGVLVLATVSFHTRRRGFLLVVLFAMSPLAVQSQEVPRNQEIAILLIDTPSAPTAQQVVDFNNNVSHNGTPPLASLASSNPQAVAYLLPLRARGDFAAFLAAHPTSVRAKLERYFGWS